MELELLIRPTIGQLMMGASFNFCSHDLKINPEINLMEEEFILSHYARL